MGQTGVRPPMRLSIFNRSDNVSGAQWPSFLTVDPPFRARLATLDFGKHLLKASAVFAVSLLLLFVLEDVPLLDQGVADISEMIVCRPPKRTNENLSWLSFDPNDKYRLS